MVLWQYVSLSSMLSFPLTFTHCHDNHSFHVWWSNVWETWSSVFFAGMLPPQCSGKHARGSEVKAQVQASRRGNQPQRANRFGANHNDPHVETPWNKSAKFCSCQTEGSDLICAGFWYNYQHRNHIFSCVERQRDLSAAASVTSCSEQSESPRSIVCVIFSAGISSYDSLMRASKLKLTHYVWWLRCCSSHQSIASVTQSGKKYSALFFSATTLPTNQSRRTSSVSFHIIRTPRGETKFVEVEALNFESPESRHWDCKKFQERAQ